MTLPAGSVKVECSPAEQEVVGSNPGRFILKTLKTGTHCALAKRSAIWDAMRVSDESQELESRPPLPSSSSE